MGRFDLRRTSLVDASVNLVPLAILVFFLLYFLAVDPWRFGPLSLVVGVGLLVVPIAVLSVATMVAAYLIQTDGGSDGDG